MACFTRIWVTLEESICEKHTYTYCVCMHEYLSVLTVHNACSVCVCVCVCVCVLCLMMLLRLWFSSRSQCMFSFRLHAYALFRLPVCACTGPNVHYTLYCDAPCPPTSLLASLLLSLLSGRPVLLGRGGEGRIASVSLLFLYTNGTAMNISFWASFAIMRFRTSPVILIVSQSQTSGTLVLLTH